MTNDLPNERSGTRAAGQVEDEDDDPVGQPPHRRRAGGVTDAEIADTIVSLLAQREDTASICPSDAARALVREDGGWHALMPRVRRVAAAMAAAGSLTVTRGGQTVNALAKGGPIRLRRPPPDSAAAPGDAV